MCISVERAHIETLIETLEASITTLKHSASERSQEFLLQLDPTYAQPAIIFRDFPKTHGNIVQRALGIALNSHIGGYTKTEMRFGFLSGSKVSIDNFFLHSSGQIYLIETKRDMSNVRLDAAEASGRKLYDVARTIEADVERLAGRPLRYPVKCIFFSYVDADKSSTIKLNIGTPSLPQSVEMPVFGRAQINELVGDCLGQFIAYFDDLVGGVISKEIPGLSLRTDKQTSDNPLRFETSVANIPESVPPEHTGEPVYESLKIESGKIIKIGDDECEAASKEDVLV
ncbi:hypothetical protein [Bradyrhizobium sp. McL0616]|uniref:hypothetical protein n=1 Tax=Bradyrhizobium sp. McL0616 TaxID=3415674 RepID=UPI003CE93EDB